MSEERSVRKPGYVEGVRVRLSDGQSWSLPLRGFVRRDDEYDALLAAVCQSEDQAEGLRAELALTVLLMTRNYDLRPDELNALLSFPPGDPALSELQRLVHELTLESIRRWRAAAGVWTSGASEGRVAPVATPPPRAGRVRWPRLFGAP
jgi:hypothetical protein